MKARLVTLGALMIAGLSLTACSPTVPMRAAEFATDPACADVIVGLQDVTAIDDNEKRQTDAQATAAWGSPATILLSCGVDVPAPSEQRCITIEGVDWLVDDSDDARGVFTTYGRDPAVQVVVDHATSDSNALNAISDAVALTPPERQCTAAEDYTTGNDAVIG